MHVDAFIFTALLGKGKQGTHRKHEVLSLMVACLQGSDAGQKCGKISRIFNFGVQL